MELNLPRKALICFGFEKCGTTTLFDRLDGSDKVNFPKQKEPYIFTSHFNELQNSGLKQFFNTNEDEKFYVDFSPNYHLSNVTTKRIKETFDEVKVIVCVREPVARAFSFYHHVLFYEIVVGSKHLAKRATRPSRERYDVPFGLSFTEVSNLRHDFYYPNYAAKVIELRKQFGKNNVHVLVMEEDLSKSSLSKDLNSFLQDDVFPENSDLAATVSNSKKAYNYFWNSKRDGWLKTGDKVFKYKKNDIIVFREEEVKKISGIRKDRASRFFGAADSWTFTLSPDEYRNIAETKFELIRPLELLIERKIESWRHYKTLSNPKVEFSFYPFLLNPLGLAMVAQGKFKRSTF